MRHSGFNRLVGQLQVAWKKDHADRVDDVPTILWEFVPVWLEDALESRELQHIGQLEVDGRAWVLLIADDKLHLLRVREEDLEVVYVGALLGAEYREIITGGHVRIELWHKRLESLKVKQPIVIDGPAVASLVQPLRALFRGWAETPAS